LKNLKREYIAICETYKKLYRHIKQRNASKNRQTWAAKVNKIGIKSTSRVNKFAAKDVATFLGGLGRRYLVAAKIAASLMHAYRL